MSSVSDSLFYVGTSNIVLPVPNKSFYPKDFRDKSRLEYYSSLLNSLEVNNSFYKIPMPITVEKWATQVPDDFKFTFKLWRGITHAKDLFYEKEDIERFLQSVDMVSKKKACILVQFPASVRCSLFTSVRKLLGYLKDQTIDTGWNIAVEFRHSSWYNEEVFAFLENSNIGLVQHDMPNSSISFPDIETDFVYLRFHGEKGDYKGSYSDVFLEEYKDYIKECTNKEQKVFAYFNNTMGDAVHNAILLQQYFREG